MKRTQLAAGAVVLLVIGAGLGYWIAREYTAHDTPSPPTQGSRKVLYWHDPMVPGKRFEKPGKSPFMDMDLVPVYADEQGADGQVRVDAAVSQNLGVRLGTVERTPVASQLRVVGSVAFDERLVALVQPRIEGSVTRLYVKAPLERVRAGQPLLEILAPQWLAAQEEYLALLDTPSARTEAIRAAARERLNVLGVPASAVRQLERERKAQPTTTLFAPVDGVITELDAREGTTFASGESLMRINGVKSVWVNAEVPESQVSFVPAGASVDVRAAAWPGVSFDGQVLGVLPDVNATTRTVPVRITVENREAKLAPGMFVSVQLKGASSKPQLSVPSEAVIYTGERSVVVTARDGAFDVVEVTTGASADGRTTILSGLTEGQSIVLSGQFLIDSEANLKSAVDRLSVPPQPPRVESPGGAPQ